MSGVVAASAAARAAAAVDLPSTPRAPAPTASLDTIDEAVTHRITGLLWRAIDRGVVGASDDVRDAAREAALAALRTCLLAESVAVRAVRTIEAADADVRVLKGVAIAHLDHDDPAERAFGDCDLLVRREQLGVALRALERAGWHRPEPPIRGWWERRYGKAVVLRPPDDDGELDLHVAITGGWFGARIDHSGFWRRSQEFELAGTRLRALHPDDRLLQAACHAMLGGSSGLRALRDVAQLILVTGADWREVAERLAALDAQLVLARAITTTWDVLRLERAHPAAAWARKERGSDAQRAALASYEAAFVEGWGPEGRAAVGSMRLPDRLLYTTGLLFPSRASLRHRGRTYSQHLRRMLRGARTGVGDG